MKDSIGHTNDMPPPAYLFDSENNQKRGLIQTIKSP